MNAKEPTIADAFISVGLAFSHRDARRLAAQGALSVNRSRVDDVDVTIPVRRGVFELHAGTQRRLFYVDPPATDEVTP